MRPTGGPALENLRLRTRRMLDAIDDTPITAMDAAYYQHYFEELRLIVEEIITIHALTGGARPARVWLLWDCADLIGIFDTEHDAREAQADVQHRLLCDFGPEPDLLESVTVTAAMLQTSWPTPDSARS